MADVKPVLASLDGLSRRIEKVLADEAVDPRYKFQLQNVQKSIDALHNVEQVIEGRPREGE